MKNERVAILQSNYIPWKGYFDIIDKVDLFIFHDDLQYTKCDWRNRNLIKTPRGLKWLTIPCGTNEKRLINEVEIKDSSWQKKHWNIIKEYYHKAPFLNYYKNFFEDIYLKKTWTNLSDFNQYLIKHISTKILKSKTKFEDSRKYDLKLRKAERVREVLIKCKAKEYLSGPAAKDYLRENFLKKAHIKLIWMNYDNYPKYPQLYPPFVHQVSIIDLIFNVGPKARHYLKKKLRD